MIFSIVLSSAFVETFSVYHTCQGKSHLSKGYAASAESSYKIPGKMQLHQEVAKRRLCDLP